MEFSQKRKGMIYGVFFLVLMSYLKIVEMGKLTTMNQRKNKIKKK